jgi:hypothetical protein
MSRKKASNWVDRFEPLEPVLSRVLGHAFGVDAADARLVEHVLTVRGLVEADASEVRVAGYVRGLFASFGLPEPDGSTSRTLGIAIWHIAKVGLVRDRAERRAAELMNQLPPEPRLAESLKAAILRAPVQASTREPIRKPMPHEVSAMRERSASRVERRSDGEET